MKSSKRILAFQSSIHSPPSSYIQFKMSSIKQLIINAIIKVSTNYPVLDREGEPTAEEARDHFTKCLLAELFPEDSCVPVSVSVSVPVIESPPKKKRAPPPKKKKEESEESEVEEEVEEESEEEVS